MVMSIVEIVSNCGLIWTFYYNAPILCLFVPYTNQRHWKDCLKLLCGCCSGLEFRGPECDYWEAFLGQGIETPFYSMSCRTSVAFRCSTKNTHCNDRGKVLCIYAIRWLSWMVHMNRHLTFSDWSWYAYCLWDCTQWRRSYWYKCEGWAKRPFSPQFLSHEAAQSLVR